MSRNSLFVSASLLLIILVSAAGISTAQKAAGFAAHLVVTVEPRQGNSVPVINRDEVMVYEGHDRDQVVDWVPRPGRARSIAVVRSDR